MLKYNKVLTERARQLRKDMTIYESALWHKYLKTYPVRIRRQKVIGDYIVDFYCSKARLVIEVDGSYHYEEDQVNLDYTRTAFLEENKLKVLRVTNEEIKQDFTYVCQTIDTEIKART